MTAEKKPTTAVVKTDSEKFTGMVIREFSALVGGNLELTPYQKRLAQHLFIKVDASLKTLENKRAGNPNQQNKAPIVWSNVNLDKLAIDAVHRVELGLDALVKNHIHPIPYYNNKLQKYDVDLQVGYVGKDYYRRKVASEEPLTIIYELVYSNDIFKPLKKSLVNDTETYEFEITKPFDRGEVIGGFGYIMFEDKRKNMLITVTEADFLKSMSLAPSKDFWTKNPVEMRYKTLVNRTTERLPIDPAKVNESYFAVEASDSEAEITANIEENANQEYIDVKAEIVQDPEIVTSSSQETVTIQGSTSEISCGSCGTMFPTSSEEGGEVYATGTCFGCKQADQLRAEGEVEMKASEDEDPGF